MTTVSFNITHSDAVRLHSELGIMLADKNIDQMQIIAESNTIHVVKARDAQDRIPDSSYEMD